MGDMTDEQEKLKRLRSQAAQLVLEGAAESVRASYEAGFPEQTIVLIGRDWPAGKCSLVHCDSFGEVTYRVAQLWCEAEV